MSKFTKLDSLYRAYLKKKRGLVCELCGKRQEVLSFPLSVFHILSKAAAPRLRYNDTNTLISCWTKGESRACHNVYHGSGHTEWHDRRKEEIKQRICELKGYTNFQDLIDYLKIQERITPKLDLKMLRTVFEEMLNA